MVYQRLILSEKANWPGMLLISCLPSWNWLQSTWWARHHLMVKLVTLWSFVRDQPRPSKISVMLNERTDAKTRKKWAYTRALSVPAKNTKSLGFFKWCNPPGWWLREKIEPCPSCSWSSRFSLLIDPFPIYDDVVSGKSDTIFSLS